MSRKLILTILALALASLELLAVRQAQINTMNQMTEFHKEIDRCNATLNTLRIEIETACSPNTLNLMFSDATDDAR